MAAKQNCGWTGSDSSQDINGILNLLLFLTNFDENPKGRPDDIIPERVNIDGSASNAIADIPRHLNTSKRNFKKIQ